MYPKAAVPAGGREGEEDVSSSFTLPEEEQGGEILVPLRLLASSHAGSSASLANEQRVTDEDKLLVRKLAASLGPPKRSSPNAHEKKKMDWIHFGKMLGDRLQGIENHVTSLGDRLVKLENGASIDDTRAEDVELRSESGPVLPPGTA